jgi:hypothetical protein
MKTSLIIIVIFLSSSVSANWFSSTNVRKIPQSLLMDFERTCTLFPLSAHTPTPRSLKNIIYVPKVTHNLLSVRQLTRDNNVFVDFHLYDVFVKGRDSREIILSGRS